MKYFILFYLALCLSTFTNGQTNLSGVWQGIIIRDGYKMEQAMLLYITLEINDKVVTGKTREEIYTTDYFAVKKIKGSFENNTLSITQFVTEKKKNSSKTNWCNLNAKLKYNDSTGYLEGKYTSSDCKTNTGRMILFRSSLKFSDQETSPSSHIWFDKFLDDLKKGLDAPAIRELERTNFKFEPIYFDYDKSEIKPEYYDFLRRMIRVVQGHTDLRIKVTGHTDADGSDAYNLELSRKRAQALIDFFVANGLSRDRIEIDFKGEKSPIDSNNTPEGKQHNRRVDFSFI